jgi:uncharacterized protein YndB with AHSA1/START domain
MAQSYQAKAEIIVNAPAEKVWEALTDPAIVKQYFFGTNMEADWKVGGEITYRGEWEGKPYEDKGHVLEIEPNKKLVTDYWSGLTGKADVPENYQRVSYELFEQDGVTTLVITQDGNPTQESADHSTSNWNMVMKGMKDLLEKSAN